MGFRVNGMVIYHLLSELQEDKGFSRCASGMSDLDMDDIEMILQQLKYEQEQEQAVESSHRHNYIYRERGDAEERIENYIQTVDPLPPHFDFFGVIWVNHLIKEETEERVKLVQ
ncbi:hypothetical protein Tco_1418945 [Tanacetum coccineum]